MRKLIVACDGTWKNSDNGFEPDKWYNPFDGKGKLADPSNVTRICRAITTSGFGDTPQVVYYQAGVGTANNFIDSTLGGGTGMGLSEHIREAFGFLTNNYQEGDEIFLVGFSRGAFTARSIAGLIGLVGIMTKKAMESFYPVFKDYENNHVKNYKPEGNMPFPNRPNIKDPAYINGLLERGLTRNQVDIQAIGVWDTVGALGIPETGIFEYLGHVANSEYRFHNTALSPNIKYAFQALALDEKRGAFGPAIWERRGDVPTKLRQVWFPGVHSNVGGGYPDQGIADITLTWMMDQLSPFIKFDEAYIQHQYESTSAANVTRDNKPSPAWANGRLYNSMTGIPSLFGSVVRTPGNYRVLTPATGKPTDELLANTSEYIHPCVRVRIGAGPGKENVGIYQPDALKDWRVVRQPATVLDEDPNKAEFVWEFKGTSKTPVKNPMIEEWKLGPMELQLLQKDAAQLKRYQTDTGAPP